MLKVIKDDPDSEEAWEYVLLIAQVLGCLKEKRGIVWRFGEKAVILPTERDIDICCYP